MHVSGFACHFHASWVPPCLFVKGYLSNSRKMCKRRINAFLTSKVGETRSRAAPTNNHDSEQEELIRKLKSESEVHNAQYLMVLQALVGLSSILWVHLCTSCTLHLLMHMLVLFFSQIIYLMKRDKEPPIAPLLGTEPGSSTTLPSPNFWTTLNLFYHVNLSIHLLPLSHPIRHTLANNGAFRYSAFIPPPYSFLYGLSVIPALLSLFTRSEWADVVWWLATPAMVYFVHSSQRWFAQEAEGLQNLEKLRYDAKGA